MYDRSPVPDALVTFRGLVPIGAGPDRHCLSRATDTHCRTGTRGITASTS